MAVTVAIVGAGPSGFYAAEALLRSRLDCQIDLLEALPTPYGLIRFGVAPDHEKTKKVSRAFEKTAMDARVRYFGNVEVGRDVSLDALRALYDAVVVAIGAPLDRALSVPGAEKSGVYGSVAFAGWYNGHPRHCGLDPDLAVTSAAIVGNGNVALDVARILVKTPEEMRATDLPEAVARRIHEAPIRDVYLIGRRGPLEAKWTNVELREMGRLRNCRPVIDRASLPGAVTGSMPDRDKRLREKNLATLRQMAEGPSTTPGKRLHFQFLAQPVEVLGDERITALRLERTRLEAGRAIGTGQFLELPCGLLVAAIGYRTPAVPGLPLDRGHVAHRDGRISTGFYVVGWAKRGAVGVIGSNKPDGAAVATQIAEDVGSGGKPGRPELVRLLRKNSAGWVSFADWKRLEAWEIAAAPPGAPRRKLTRLSEMLDVVARSEPQT